MRIGPTSTARPRASRFARLAGWSYRHRGAALALWLAVLVGVSLGSSAIGSDYHNDFSLPGTESQEAVDALQAGAPQWAGDTIQVVVHDDGGVRAPAIRDRIEAILDDVRTLPGVAAVSSPYETHETAISRDGTIAYATVTLDRRAEEVPKDDVRRMIEVARSGAGNGLEVQLGGDAVREAEEPEGGAAEGAGMLAALVVLVLLFGSLLAATLPLATAIFAVVTTMGLIVMASHLVDVADYTPPMMTLVGLGVGIDYALLIFSRFRSELLGGAPREVAVRTALDTAGRSVFFAAITVIIALLGLVAFGLASLQGVALAVALTVLVTMIAALTLLPALLAITGRRIERRLKRRAQRTDGERWRRWSALVQRRPRLAIAAAGAVLLALAAPALGMQLGFADAGNDPRSMTSRQAYDLLSKGFGPGFSGPLVVVAQGDADAAAELQRTLARTRGIAGVTPPSAEGEIATVVAFPASAPQDAVTDELVTRLRDDVLPPLERSTGATFLVGGSTAAASDFSSEVAERLPLFVAIVVGLSALLLTMVFRSVLIPLKAALLNLLSIGASLGVITLVFQEGMAGVDPGPIEAFVPVLIFAIVFGLSMDYEVFLVTRMHEDWERRRNARRAISEGLATTGRVVTAAGAIMVVVFGAFILAPNRMLQQFGLGLAVAILLDAFVIRSLLVPAVMQLLGERAWWLPRWLRQRLPKLAIEPEMADVPSAVRGTL